MIPIQIKHFPIAVISLAFGNLFPSWCVVDIYNESQICKTYHHAVLLGMENDLFFLLVAFVDLTLPFLEPGITVVKR